MTNWEVLNVIYKILLLGIFSVSDAGLEHFIPMWLEVPLKQFYNNVNYNCTPLTCISMNALGGFSVIEVTIFLYNISPPKYFDDVEQKHGAYK